MPGHRTPGPGTRRSRLVAARPVRAGGILLLTAVLAVAGVLVGARLARSGALPGSTVGDADVAGMDQAALEVLLGEAAAARRGTAIELRGPGGSAAALAGALGLDVDVEATAAAVLRRGRQLNPLAALADQVLATAAERGWATLRTPLHQHLDGATFGDVVEQLGVQIGVPPLQGQIVVVDGQVQVLPPPPGTTIDVAALESAVLAALDGPPPYAVEVPTTTSAPTHDAGAIAALESLAERAISAPATLTRGDVAITLHPEDLARVLVVRARPVSGAPDAAELRLAVDADALAALLPLDRLRALDTPPQDATFVTAGQRIDVVPARDGFAVDPVIAARQLLDLVTDVGSRTAALEGRRTPPALSTAAAADLGITTPVSSFTTEHACCEGRVTNIHRIADLVDGTVVLPGQTSSLNALVGPRTTANGFVDGGAISGGEFVEQVGGGVSQFTTTLFNAVFFAGYDIEEFKPHSYYIPRYPLGREATLNFDPPVDLRWTNDSPTAVFIGATYTDTSVTVTLWSQPYATVTSQTSDRYGFSDPTERREVTEDLPAGEERVLQEGSRGFRVDFTREIDYVDGRRSSESYTTTYQAQPRIIGVGSDTGDPDDAEASEEASEPDPAAPADAGSDPSPPRPDPPPPPPAPAPPPPAAPPPPPPPPPPPAPAPAPTGPAPATPPPPA